MIPITVENGIASVRVDTADFGDFVGRYYARCYALDPSGNTASAVLANGQGVDLCVADADEGMCRVTEDGTGVYNAPRTKANGADTLVYTLDADTKLTITGSYENEVGEIWYRLEDGHWVNSQAVIRMNDLMVYIDAAIANAMSDPE